MSSGPEHYAEAERMVAHVEQQAVELVAACAANGGRAADLTATNEVIANMTAVAQVHATLALAAAMATTAQWDTDEDLVALHADPGWEAVLGFTRIEATS